MPLWHSEEERGSLREQDESAMSAGRKPTTEKKRNVCHYKEVEYEYEWLTVVPGGELYVDAAIITGEGGVQGDDQLHRLPVLPQIQAARWDGDAGRDGNTNTVNLADDNLTQVEVTSHGQYVVVVRVREARFQQCSFFWPFSCWFGRPLYPENHFFRFTILTECKIWPPVIATARHFLSIKVILNENKNRYSF